MDLKQIEYIVKIAETGNITRAAEQLFVTQSALNQQLLKLENALGIKLFYRRKHDLTPTDAGKVYLKYGRQMLIKKGSLQHHQRPCSRQLRPSFLYLFSGARP